MEALPREHLERLIFFEHVREQAEQEYRRNDKDAENLTRWGGALLELAHFRQGPDALELVIEAEKRLDEALKIEADKHDALWCMGNCLTAQGFMYTEPSRAGRYFERARNCFAKALEKDPSNELYKKSLDSCAQAPALHMEIQRALAQQQQQQQQHHLQLGDGGEGAGAGGFGSLLSGAGGRGRKKKSTLKYDIIGWVVLTGLVVTFIAMSKNAPAR